MASVFLAVVLAKADAVSITADVARAVVVVVW